MEISTARHLVVDGVGEPGSDSFQRCLGALYAVAYTIKFAGKGDGRDFVVGKLEALYPSPREESATVPGEERSWRMMIRVPEWVDRGDLGAAVSALRAKGKEGDFETVQLESMEEGLCVQALHVGPYEDGERTHRRMAGYCSERQLVQVGPHLEIYLSDPRRIPAERLRTIQRQPVRR